MAKTECRTVVSRREHRLAWLTLLTVAALQACETPERSPYSYYDARIQPILKFGCQRQTTGCHVDNGSGFALGNLDLSSYDALTKRSDVLEPFGPYSVPLLLLKGGDPIDIQVSTVDPPDPTKPDRRFVSVTTDIRHGGGEGAIAQGSHDYALLKQWIDGGHTKNGAPPHVSVNANVGKCVSGVGSLRSIDVSRIPDDQTSFLHFVGEVQPVLIQSCAGSSCHGSQTANLFLSCGQTPEEQRWNYAVALRYLDVQAVTSELLRRPLATRAGGVFHEGGDVFADTTDAGYRAIFAFAQDVASRRPDLLRFEPLADEGGLRFFANRVQPLLVRKGCMFLACHSPSMFHDLRLRGGAEGAFSEVATRRNYEMSRLMLALESPDPNDSRLVAKNLCPAQAGGHGVKHRGGALFEDFGGCAGASTQASVDRCAGIDADQGDLNKIPAYCVFARWHAIERAASVASGELDAARGPRGVLWVSRPEGVGGPTDFNTFRPGADLVYADATVDAAGHVTLGTPRSLLGACGLSSAIDVRGPALSWDAERVAVGLRASAAVPFRLYELSVDGSRCAPIPGLASADTSQSGILLHDFDPAYAPDGRIVFASTRGYIAGDSGLSGPTRTPAALEPNANLYVFDPAANPKVRQLTFLLDQEIQPSFMRDGRVILTAEKRGEDFHQLAARRQNLDGADYHPLFAQRPSIGFAAATELRELANRNFVMVAAPLDAVDGGGAIVVVNRSIGPDQDDRDPSDSGYIHSLTTPVPGAFGGGTGVFRSPVPLPTGFLIAACDLDATDLSRGPRHYGLCELDPSGALAPKLLYRDPTHVAIEAVAVYSRVPSAIFRSRADEPNGSTFIEPGGDTSAIVSVLDAPLLGTLLFANTRTGRTIDPRVQGLALFAPEPPPNSATSFDGLGADVISDRFGRFYQSLRSVGTVALRADGSVRMQIPGGTPLSLGLTDTSGTLLSFPDGAVFSGAMRQREAIQFYPGERAKQAMPRRFFNGLCGGCHGSVSGHELDIVVNIDALTSASRTDASDELFDLR